MPNAELRRIAPRIGKFFAGMIVLPVLLCPAYPTHARAKALADTAAAAEAGKAAAPAAAQPALPGAGNAAHVFVILAIIIFLFGLFSGHDWTLFALRQANLENPEYYSRYAKFSVTFLSALLTWTAGGYAFDSADATRLGTAYFFIVLGDVIFFFNVHSVWGVCSFALAHLLLIRRNAFGLSAWPAQGWMWALLAAILCGSLLLMFVVFYPRLRRDRSYFALLTGYAVIIGGSLWAAFVALTTGFFPHGNALLIAVGVTLFFLSDICVGFYRSLPTGYPQVLATYLTWVFYAPALVVTALSSYDLQWIVKYLLG